MTRTLLLLHRYLGIGLSLLLVLWCLSGFVMMYAQYPELTDDEQLRGLAELRLEECCAWPDDFSDIDLERFRIEMLADRPVIRLDANFGTFTLDLARGLYLDEFDATSAARLAADAAARFGLGTNPRYRGAVTLDQWTVGAGLGRHQPLYRFSADDPAGTEFYLSSTTGEVVQMTTARERFWGWLGPVVHWIYPTMLRRHVSVWIQTIIWTTLLGLFLTAIGIYVGISQLKRRRNGSLSPYRGMKLWHHYAGLLFGVLTLTWLFSGLLSVTPWGTFEGRSFATEARRIHGQTLRLEHAQNLLADFPTAALPDRTVRLEGEMFNGRVYLGALTASGQRLRLDGETYAPSPLTKPALDAVAAKLRPAAELVGHNWLSQEDAYYYSHHIERRLPVYRIQYADGERIYLDGSTGQLSFAVDADRRKSRWLFLALHRGDFAAAVRQRPVWDIMMWALLLGVTAGAVTGAWLGVQRMARAVRRYRRRYEPTPTTHTR